MVPLLEIFSQGEEIVTGQVTDTNATWLSVQAIDLGFEVTRHTAVGDKLENLASLLLEIAARADCCLCSGGLGPTSDDLTADAVAMAFALPLQFDEIAFEQIQQYYAQRHRAMPVINRKQAYLPLNSVRLDNSTGTAPGFAIHYGRCWFAFMPGVPSEMKIMFLSQVLPKLQRQFILTPRRLVVIKTIGLGESALQELVAPITIPNEVQVGFRAAYEVQLKLLFPPSYPKFSLEALTRSLVAKIGHYVYAVDGLDDKPPVDLLMVINQLMLDRQHQLFILEMASGGLLAAKCAGNIWLVGGQIVPSLEQLRTSYNWSDDPQTNLETEAALVATAICKQRGATLILVQLAAPPSSNLNQQTHEFHILVWTQNKSQYVRQTLTGAGEHRQQQAMWLSLDVLRQFLLHETAADLR